MVVLVTTNILSKIYLSPREGLFYMKTVPRIGRFLHNNLSPVLTNKAGTKGAEEGGVSHGYHTTHHTYILRLVYQGYQTSAARVSLLHSWCSLKLEPHPLFLLNLSPFLSPPSQPLTLATLDSKTLQASFLPPAQEPSV